MENKGRPQEFWDERYRSGETPWDYGGSPAEWVSFLRGLPESTRLLVPGCGLAHDLQAALSLGLDAWGIDLSVAAVEKARTGFGIEAERLVAGDYFGHRFPAGTFDVIYERTFLCALAPEMRTAYVARMVELLRPGGFLVGYFFYGEEPDPPPHPLNPGEEQQLFGRAFTLEESRPSVGPLPLFVGREWWQIWRRRES